MFQRIERDLISVDYLLPSNSRPHLKFPIRTKGDQKYGCERGRFGVLFEGDRPASLEVFLIKDAEGRILCVEPDLSQSYFAYRLKLSRRLSFNCFSFMNKAPHLVNSARVVRISREPFSCETVNVVECRRLS